MENKDEEGNSIDETHYNDQTRDEGGAPRRKRPIVSPGAGTLQAAFEAFHKHDLDEDHLISVAELYSVLSDAGLDVDLDDVRDIVALADMDSSGYLDFEEFYSIYVGLEIFKHLDKNKSSSIRKKDLARTLAGYGLDSNELHLRKMLKMVNAEDDEGVTLDEFLRIYINAHHLHHKNIDLLEHAVRHWYSGAAKDAIYAATHNLSPAQDFIAGTFAGIAITLVGHPFDTIKVRLQTQEKAIFKGALDATFKTIKGEGVRGLYKGMGSPMATIPIINAIVFAAYGQAKSWFADPKNPNAPLTLGQLAVAGGYAGLVNSLVVSPVELIKTRLQIQYEAVAAGRGDLFGSMLLRNYWKGPAAGGSQNGGAAVRTQPAFKGPLDCIAKIYRALGLRGLMRGMTATLYRETPAYMGQFVTYELIKRYMIFLQGKGTPDDLHPVELMLAGGFAGISAWVVSYPMDLIKSQIQADPEFMQGKSRYKKNRFLLDGGFFDCLKQNVKSGGFASLWKGFAPCVARAFPANAAGFLAYESVGKVLRGSSTWAALPGLTAAAPSSSPASSSS